MRKAVAFIAAILGIGSLSIAVAQTTRNPLAPPVRQTQLPAPPTTPPAQGAAPLTTDDVNAWLDGYMPYAIARADICSMAVFE